MISLGPLLVVGSDRFSLLSSWRWMLPVLKYTEYYIMIRNIII